MLSLMDAGMEVWNKIIRSERPVPQTYWTAHAHLPANVESCPGTLCYDSP